jgi:hypothetical protein
MVRVFAIRVRSWFNITRVAVQAGTEPEIGQGAEVKL